MSELPNTQVIQKSIDKSLEDSNVKLAQIKNLFQQMYDEFRITVNQFDEKSNEVVKKTIALGIQCENMEKELGIMESKKIEFLEREREIINKEAELKKESDELLELHKTLNNRKSVLDAKEKELKEQQRRSV